MASSHEVYLKLGGLENAVKGINESLQAMRAAQDRAAERAEAARGALHSKVDGLHQDVAALDRRVEVEITSLKRHIEDVDVKATSAKEAADDYRRVVQQGKGALFVVGLGGTALGASLIWFFDGALAWLRTRMGL